MNCQEQKKIEKQYIFRFFPVYCIEMSRLCITFECCFMLCFEVLLCSEEKNKGMESWVVYSSGSYCLFISMGPDLLNHNYDISLP